jgi:glutathione S-transferase
MGCSQSAKENDVKTGKSGAVQAYYLPVSQTSMSVMLLASELDPNHTGVVVDLMKGEHKEAKYLEVNPYGLIPAMKDGSFCLGESNACLRYLAITYGKQFYPFDSSPQACGKIDFAIDAFSMVYKKHVPIVYTVFGFAEAPQDQAAANQEYVDAINKWFDTHVKEGKFVTGDVPSIADFKAVTFLYAASQPVMKEKLGFCIPDRAVKYCDDFFEAVSACKHLAAMKGYALSKSETKEERKEPQPGSVPAKSLFSKPTTMQKPSSPISCFTFPVSQNATGVVLLAKELGVGEPVVWDLPNGGHKTPEALAIHPYGQIPAIKDGDYCLGESLAQLRYLALAYGSKFYPAATNPQLCGKIDFALEAFSKVYDAHMPVVYPALGFAGPPPDQAAANEAYVKAINTWFATHVDNEKAKKFVGGDQLTIADFKAAPFFYAAMHDQVMKKTGCQPPQRMKDYVAAFISACPTAKFLDEVMGSTITTILGEKN